MTAPPLPAEFAERFDSIFGDEHRIRWSEKAKVWCFEQKVGRAALPTHSENPFDDGYIRRRDGYALVMEVRPGTFMFCPRCHMKLDVPRFKVAEVPCAYCMSRGVDSRYKACWFPLGETLLDYLKMLDPERCDTMARVKAADEKVATTKRLAEEGAQREASAQLKDHLIEQIPKAGFPSLVPDGWRH